VGLFLRAFLYLLQTRGRRQVMPVAYTRKPQIKIDDYRNMVYSMFGARRLMRLMNLRPFTTIISLNNALVRSEVRRRKWLLPPLVRTSVPEPVKRNLLDVALCVFSLILPDFFALRGIANSLLSEN
jgi:hypothetical protein